MNTGPWVVTTLDGVQDVIEGGFSIDADFMSVTFLIGETCTGVYNFGAVRSILPLVGDDE